MVDGIGEHRRIVIYFGSIVGAIVLVNTPVPRVVLSALLGSQAGEGLATGMVEFTQGLFLLLLVSLYFEFVRSRDRSKAIEELGAQITELRANVDGLSSSGLRELALRTVEPDQLLTAAVQRVTKAAGYSASLVRQVVPRRALYENVTIAVRVTGIVDDQVSVFMSTYSVRRLLKGQAQGI